MFFAFAAGGLAFGAAFNEHVPLHIFATVTVAVYWGLLEIQARKAVDVHTQHPESVYIVGYIATIGGFAGLAVFLGKDATRITDFKVTLPMILERGGFAVISTLVGLVAMNVLKLQADARSTPKNEQEEFIQQFSKTFANEFTKSLGSAEQTAAFSENLARMTGQMTSSAAAMDRLQTTGEQVELAMQAAEKRMPQLVDALVQFEELTNKVLPAWREITKQVGDAATFSHSYHRA